MYEKAVRLASAKYIPIQGQSLNNVRIAGKSYVRLGRVVCSSKQGRKNEHIPDTIYLQNS